MNTGPGAAAWHRPTRLAEALEIKARLAGEVQVIAGGTDLMVGWGGAPRPVSAWLDVSGLPELGTIDHGPDALTIGAAVSCHRIACHPVIAQRFDMLRQSARQTGSVAIQNRATLGGNVMNASPAADNPPVLLAYGAELVLASTAGTRTVPYRTFHCGYRQTIARADELVVAVRLPFPAPGAVQFYRKVGTRRAQAISKVALAALIEFAPPSAVPGTRRIAGARFGFASVGPTPLLADALAAALAGQDWATIDAARWSAALDADLAPIDDIRSTRAYRREVAHNLVAAALRAG